MAPHIDWDNIHEHIHDNDVRYQRRLRRKKLYITCSPSITPADTGSLKKLKTVNDENFMGKKQLVLACPNHGRRNDVDHDMEIFKEGFKENEQSLVCKAVDTVSDDVSLKKLEFVQDRNFLCDDDFWVECSNVVGNLEPIGVKCGTRGDFVDPDVEMFEEDLEVECGTRENVVDSNLKMCKGDLDFKVECGARRNVVDPDFKMFNENYKVDGDSFVLQVKNNDGSSEFLKYEKDVLRMEYTRKMKGDNNKSVLGRDTEKKRKKDKGVPRGDVNFVSTKEKRNEKVRGEWFSRNSNRFTVAKRSLVVERGDDIEIIFTGKPNENEEVTVSKNDRPSRIVKNKRPLKMNDGCNIKCLRKSKKQYEKLDRRLCLTRTDHVSNRVDIVGKAKRHLAVVSRASARSKTTGNKQRDIAVQQGEDIQNLRFSSGTGNMDVMVEEKFDDSTNVVLVKKSMQMIKGRDSVYDDNLRTRYKCNKKFGMYSEVKEENASSLKYEEHNEHSPDLEILRKSKKQHKKLERRPCLTRTGHVSNEMNIAGKVKRHLEVSSRQSAKYQRTSPRNDRKDLVVQKGEIIENSRFSSGTGNMDVVVKEGKFDDRTNVILGKKSMQMIYGRDDVYDDNLQPRYTCDKKLGKYAEVKKENANCLKYDEEDNEHSSDLQLLRKSKKRHEKLERRPCLTRADHVRDPTVGGDLVVQQGEDKENSLFSSGIGNMAVMVKEENFDDSTNVVLVEKSMQTISGRDSVYDNNLPPWYECDKKFGKYSEFKEENAKSLKYGEADNEDSSDLEILETDNQQNFSKFEVMKVFNDSVIEDNPLSMKVASDYKTSAFREELMDILRKPFNPEEYRSLMQKAKYRHLNWGPEYSDGLKEKDVPNAYGKSPLDYHPDVQRRLRRCRRISKRLNILRGFIYWYGRTCQDGAFKPWLDKACLAVTPSPR